MALVPASEIHFLHLENEESREEELPRSQTRFAAFRSLGKWRIGGEELD